MPRCASSSIPLFAIGPGKAAAHVPEEFRLEQRIGETGTVHGDKRRPVAGGMIVDISRDQILAHAALAGNQHLRRDSLPRGQPS